MSSNPESSNPEKPNRRPRFSLLNLLLLTAIAAMALVIFRLAPLYWEVRELRRAAGILEIGDKRLVHAIGVETYQQRAWKWRVWCPAGKKVVVHVATADIPTSQPANRPTDYPPRARGGLELNRGKPDGTEVEVSLAADKNPDGTARWNLHSGGVTHHLAVPNEASDWLLKGCSGWSGGGTMSWTATEQPGRRLQLLRLGALYSRGPPPPPSPATTTDGVMAWIEAEDR